MAKNIYIVEDEPDIREALAYNFKKEGFNTIEFSNGEDCLQEINKQKPDVLILDIMLPGISGLDVCREIRSDEASSDLISRQTSRPEIPGSIISRISTSGFCLLISCKQSSPLENSIVLKPSFLKL